MFINLGKLSINLLLKRKILEIKNMYQILTLGKNNRNPVILLK